MIATYTDGTPVQEGDSIRYRQAPGGLLPASPDWAYGTAKPYPHTPAERARIDAYRASQAAKGLETFMDPDELYLFCIEHEGTRYERPAYYHITGGHIVERVPA